MITKDELRSGLQKISQHDRFFKEGRFLLCKEVYGDERDERASAMEMECTDYFDEGVDALYKALNEEGPAWLSEKLKRDRGGFDFKE